MGTIMGNGVTIRGGSRAGAKISTTLNEDGTQNVFIEDKVNNVIDTTKSIFSVYYNKVLVPLHKGDEPSSDIPLSGDLAVGNLVTFDDKSWRVVHNEGTKWYLASSTISENTQFGSNTVYKVSTLANKCASYLNNFSASAQSFMQNVTVNGVTAKVFVPSYEQVNGGFSYYNSNANRICQLNGANSNWWTSSPSSSSVYVVGADGALYGSGPSRSNGFRPHICIDTSLSGSDTKILAGTYTFKNTLTSVSSDVTGSFVFSTNSINMIKMVFTTKNILQYWQDTAGYTPAYDNTSWRDNILKTVILPYDATVDTDFYTWFTSNTTKTS